MLFCEDGFSFVSLLTPEIGFIRFNSPGEDLWNILGENSSYYCESSHDPSAFKGFTGRDVLIALFKEEPIEKVFPLISGQTKWKTMRPKSVLALRTASFLLPNRYTFLTCIWGIGF
jgi:hypothetical protein